MTAQALRDWRDRLNLTRKQAAEILGISVKSIEFYEYSGRRIPRHVEITTKLLELAKSS